MKRLIFSLVAIIFLAFSCQKEDLIVNGDEKVNEQEVESRSTGHADVNFDSVNPVKVTGTNVSTEITVINSGCGSTSVCTNPGYLYYYLSSDCSLDGSDTYLGSDYVTDLCYLDHSEETAYFTSLPTGTHYILFVLDATDTTYEGSCENNNVACEQFTIL